MNALRQEVSDDARQDLAVQYEWYWREAGEDIAERYLAAFRQTLDLIAQQPEMGMLRRFRSPRLRGIRSFQMLRAFRVHTLFYRIETDTLVVFRVLHGMRDLPRRLFDPPGATRQPLTSLCPSTTRQAHHALKRMTPFLTAPPASSIEPDASLNPKLPRASPRPFKSPT